MKRTYWIIFAVLSVVVFSCKKSSEFLNPVYMCNCGSLVWQSEAFTLNNAEYVLAHDTLPLSRQYYLTADVAAEGEVGTHSLNIYFDLDSADHPQFFIPDDTVSVYIEEIDENAAIPFKTYQAVNGVINVNGALLGGTERVSMDLILQQTTNGVPVGFEIPFKG
ncbi:MAG: hypothetical protein ACPGED_03180, partial [Flavobacteriales bacterium]